MEKVIKIPQPYATMIVAGLIKVVPRILPSPLLSGEIYIYATAQSTTQQTPLEVVQTVYNHQVVGNLPPIDRLPVNALVGYVKVRIDPYIDTTMWGRFFNVPLCRVTYAAEFSPAIPIPFSTLKSLGEVDFAAEFNSHRYVLQADMWVEAGIMHLPLNDRLFNECPGNSLKIDVTPALAAQFLDEDGNLRYDINAVIVKNRHRINFYEFDAELVAELDENGEPVLYPTLGGNGLQDVRLQLVVNFKTAIIR